MFSVAAEVGNLYSGESATVKALVDTGASYTVLARDLLARLGIQPTERERSQLGDGRHVVYDVGYAELRLEGKRRPTIVIFGPPGVGPLLGADTLQQFRLIADSVNEWLIPMEPIRTRLI
jgi:predicted aspartyl protease